jgi:hypothetical protein
LLYFLSGQYFMVVLFSSLLGDALLGWPPNHW